MGTSFSQEKFLKASLKETILDGNDQELKLNLLDQDKINQTSNLIQEQNSMGQTLLHQVRYLT